MVNTVMSVKKADISAPVSAVVEVYSASGCRYCAIAKAKLKELRVPFTEIDVTESADDPSSAHRRKALAERVGRTSVPQIFVAGELLGGCDSLLSAVEDGSFSQRLSAAGIAVGPDDGASLPQADPVAQLPKIELVPKDNILNYHLNLPAGTKVDAAAVAQDLQVNTHTHTHTKLSCSVSHTHTHKYTHTHTHTHTHKSCRHAR